MSNNEYNSESIPEEFKKYIIYKYGSFAIKAKLTNHIMTFGRFSSQDVACAATKLLIDHDWDIRNISKEPLSEYGNYYYVFKVMNNSLIFDSKFELFEKAVEYLEINSKCNDYHNDVFNRKKKKSRFENLPHYQLDNQSEEEIDIPNIYFKKGLYSVRFKSNGKDYGVFSSIEEAKVAKSLLIENNWKLRNSVEIKFYNSVYWIFKIKDYMLFFINKFESYEDVMDCLAEISSENYKIDNPVESKKYKSPINKNTKSKSKQVKSSSSSVKHKSKSKQVKSSSSSVKHKSKSKRNSVKNKSKIPKNQFYKVRAKHKFSKDNIVIKYLEEYESNKIKIDAKNFKSEIYIIKFQDNTLMDYYSISFSADSGFKFSNNIDELVGFEYIFKILFVNNWNLDKINRLSSIHFFEDKYHILTSFDDKLIISGPFNSYEEAEENIGFLYDFYSKDFDKQIPQSIRKHGDFYKFIENHNGETFEIAYQKSLESLKAIIDIFEYYMWNPEMFSDFYIFYYHGLYWEIDYFNYYIKLFGKFNSQEDVIEHKINSN